EFRLGLRVAFLIEPDDAQVQMRFVVARVQLDGSLELINRFLTLAEGGLGETKPAVSLGVVGIKLQSVLVITRDLGERFQLKAFLQRRPILEAAGQHLEPKLAHLIGGLLAELDSLRRAVRIAWIRVGVVVAVLHPYLSPLGQKHGLTKAV